MLETNEVLATKEVAYGYPTVQKYYEDLEHNNPVWLEKYSRELLKLRAERRK